MQIQLNTDRHLEKSESLQEYVEKELSDRLSNHVERLTRIEVHIGDENADKESPTDKFCTLEARPRGMDPIVVKHNADTMHDAITGAASRMERVLRKSFEKRDEVRPR